MDRLERAVALLILPHRLDTLIRPIMADEVSDAQGKNYSGIPGNSRDARKTVAISTVFSRTR